jgi:bacterioferritin (cytochrome b1)
MATGDGSAEPGKGADMAQELLEEQQAIERLNAALSLQMRSALQYSLVAAGVTGFEGVAIVNLLTEYGDRELADARLLIEKIVSFGGKPTTEVAELRATSGLDQGAEWLIECETAAVDALQEAIEPTGREGRSEALEHMLEHAIMRKQRQIDFLERARAA